jgi:hypothetical protein
VTPALREALARFALFSGSSGPVTRTLRFAEYQTFW